MAAAAYLALLLMVVTSVTPKTINKIIEDSLKDVPSAHGALPRLSDGTFLTQLDIRLTKEQYEDLMNRQKDGTDSRSKRKAIPHDYSRWPENTMPYTISSHFESWVVENIHTAMSEWEKYTCVRFRKVTEQDPNYVSIERGQGCNSYVGVINWGKQIMNLGVGCESVHTIVHELGHAIGLHHEQVRRDRDDYLWVRFDHIDPYYRYNSEMEREDNIDNYGVAYDYASIMHYGEDAFGMSQEPTMVTHDPSWQFRIGKVDKLSFKDVQIVNIMYKCDAHCPTQTCPDGGFLDQNCQCLCPGDIYGNPIKLCGTPDIKVDNCVNQDEYCDYWADVGECTRNPSWMKWYCQKACGFCGSGCKDKRSDCQSLAYRGDCKANPLFMFDECMETCGVCSDIGEKTGCRDDNPQCAYWASIGECYNNPGYMRTSCKRSCASC